MMKQFLKCSDNFLKIFSVSIFFFTLLLPVTSFGIGLSCTVSGSCAASETDILHLSGTTNGHAELPSGSNYTNKVCCSTTPSVILETNCSGAYAEIGNLSATTDAHFEEKTESNYATDACISSTISGDSLTVGYQNSNCTGYDTTLFSISDTPTNAHVGNAAAYTRKVCGTYEPASLSFSISDNSIGFGKFSLTSARYATGDTLGTGTDGTPAHNMTIQTDAPYGYTLTYVGDTLESATDSFPSTTNITGDSDGDPGVTGAFGLALDTNGSSDIASGYLHVNNDWAWASNVTTVIASYTSPVGSTETFDTYYLGNITPTLDPGAYTTTITYIATGNF